MTNTVYQRLNNFLAAYRIIDNNTKRYYSRYFLKELAKGKCGWENIKKYLAFEQEEETRRELSLEEVTDLLNNYANADKYDDYFYDISLRYEFDGTKIYECIKDPNAYRILGFKDGIEKEG